MISTTTFATRSSIAAFAASLFLALSAQAALVWNDIQIGGFVSQGFLYNTGDNDYIGETSEGAFDFREYAVNASYATGKFRFGAQAFAQKLGVYGDDKISLDWASVDYQYARWLGVRAGRVKTPRGLYNEALDVDSIRPFVLLPQSVYDARLRDFNASFDGAMLYGNIRLPREFGSLDYKVYFGDIPMELDSGANDFFNNDLAAPNTRLGMDAALGGSLFWNTPINGLRVGYSESVFRDFGMLRDVSMFGSALTLYREADSYSRRLFSAEYIYGDWVFAAETGREGAYYDIGMEGAPAMYYMDYGIEYAYVSAARRLSDRIEIGAYASYSKETQPIIGDVDGFALPDLEQRDYALSFRYDFNYNWLAKAEVHYMDGAGKIFTTPSYPQPLELRDTSWILFALKTTYSF